MNETVGTAVMKRISIKKNSGSMVWEGRSVKVKMGSGGMLTVSHANGSIATCAPTMIKDMRALADELESFEEMREAEGLQQDFLSARYVPPLETLQKGKDPVLTKEQSELFSLFYEQEWHRSEVKLFKYQGNLAAQNKAQVKLDKTRAKIEAFKAKHAKGQG